MEECLLYQSVLLFCNEYEPTLEELGKINDAHALIAHIKQTVAVMGANDSEIPELDSILEDLHARTCAPEEAIQKARAIESRKMDYH